MSEVTAEAKHWEELFRFPVPAQTVDATPSTWLIRNAFEE